MESDWAQQRRQNALMQAERLRQREAAESAQAAQYLKRFVAAAKRVGLPAQPLLVRSGNGKTAKTTLRGWYLKVDQSVGVDEDGNFYLLTAPLTLAQRLRGHTPEPVPPTLILGKGGRDGEQVDLTQALSARIPTWQQGEEGNPEPEGV